MLHQYKYENNINNSNNKNNNNKGDAHFTSGYTRV